MSLIANALFSSSKQKVLGLLYGQPHRSFYLKEILRSSEMGVSSIRNELERLLAAGIITKTSIGNQHHFQANQECPIFDELKSIVMKTIGLVDIIEKALNELSGEIELAFIYGSVAKKTEHKDSDIDLFVLANNLSYAGLMERLYEPSVFLGRTINPSIYTKEQLLEKIADKNSFINRILEQPKLWIIGNNDELSAVRKPG